MPKKLYGSIDFSKLLERAKQGDKAFTKAENGKIYLNVSVWINDVEDKYGNIASFQSNFKEATKDDRFYFGNAKDGGSGGSPVDADEIPEGDDLPF